MAANTNQEDAELFDFQNIEEQGNYLTHAHTSAHAHAHVALARHHHTRLLTVHTKFILAHISRRA